MHLTDRRAPSIVAYPESPSRAPNSLRGKDGKFSVGQTGRPSNDPTKGRVFAASNALAFLEKKTRKAFNTAQNERKQISDRIQTAPPVFSIQEVPDKKKFELSQTCRGWKMQAAQYFDLSLTEVEEKKLVDSMIVTETLANSITPTSKVFICTFAGDLEAVALITDKGSNLELELLASNPKNLIEEKRSVKGSGTALLNFLFQKCVSENKDFLKLYSRRSSIGFYERMGFEVERDGESSMIDENQNIPMCISAEKIREILNNCSR